VAGCNEDLIRGFSVGALITAGILILSFIIFNKAWDDGYKTAYRDYKIIGEPVFSERVKNAYPDLEKEKKEGTK